MWPGNVAWGCGLEMWPGDGAWEWGLGCGLGWGLGMGPGMWPGNGAWDVAWKWGLGWGLGMGLLHIIFIASKIVLWLASRSQPRLRVRITLASQHTWSCVIAQK